MERGRAASAVPYTDHDHEITSCMFSALQLQCVVALDHVLVPLLLLAIAAACYLWFGKMGGGAGAGPAGLIRRTGGRRNLPPGSMGLPLGLGETLQFAFCNTCPIGTPPPFFSSRLRRYGTVFTTHLIGYPTVVSMDLELNKLLLSNEEKLVQVNFPSFIKAIVGPVLTLHGARNRRFRELSLSMVSPAAIQARHLIPVQTFAHSILVCWSDKVVVDAQNEAKKFIFTYMVNALVSLAPDDPNTISLMENYNYLMNGYSAIPLNLPGTTYNKVLKARRRITAIFRSLLLARRKVARVEQHKDFLDLLMEEMDESGRPFSEEDIVEFIIALVLAGFETTSTLITNVIKYLSENAHVVDELRKEHTFIRRNKKANEMLAWEDFKQMQSTEFVIKETLRMASIAHFLARETLQDVFFKDMVIPKGWTVLITFAMVHLSPTYFKDPLKFDPWRWKDTESNNQAFLMPFGGGIRSCLGAVLAKFEVSIFIHYLVTSYRWERIMEAQGQLDVVSSFSFPTMEKGLLIRVEPLHTSSLMA